MNTLIGILTLGVVAYTLRRINRMSQALVDAINNLKTEVSETLQAVSDKLAEIAGNTDDQAAADAINAQATALDDLQKGALALTPVQPAPEPAPVDPEPTT